jgi:hypothetical protein
MSKLLVSMSKLFRLPRSSLVATLVLSSALAPSTPAQDTDAKVRALEQRVDELSTQLATFLERQATETPAAAGSGARWYDRFTLGGYGEMHLNFRQGSDQDVLDAHRFVLYLGYEFADWIQLHSELELEHAKVEDGNGELKFEQLHVDFLLDQPLNVRAGRFLVPVGIVNQTHEPTTFLSVERPSVETAIVPTTWTSDGIGVFGHASDSIGYELYVGSGLDGSAFSSVQGIRGGRLDERPGINEPAVTGRIDWLAPFANDRQSLRTGLSFFAGGLDNGNRGTSGAPGELAMYAADARYRFRDLELRGLWATGRIDDAELLNASFGDNVASRIEGWYVEAAWHFWPDDWRHGKLAHADAAVFARFEDYDTQRRMPAGFARDPAGHRREWTLGVAFFPVEQLVVKADWQIRDDDTADGLADLINVGIGWQF